jgi:hypothetical protein
MVSLIEHRDDRRASRRGQEVLNPLTFQTRHDLFNQAESDLIFNILDDVETRATA